MDIRKFFESKNIKKAKFEETSPPENKKDLHQAVA
jgi:hypothetical protein